MPFISEILLEFHSRLLNLRLKRTKLFRINKKKKHLKKRGKKMFLNT